MPIKTAFLSDIHGNRPALQAVLEDIQRENCTRVFMLGDIINGIDPHGCVELLRSWSSEQNVELACIQGNAEAYLVISERENVPMQGEAWVQDMLGLIQWFETQLTPADLDWIRSFPATLRWNGAYLVHDSPLDRLAVQNTSDPDILPQYREWFFHGRGLTPDMVDTQEWQKLLDYMQAEQLSQVFCGHTHLPWQKQVGNRLVCNLGSVGMPLDGDPRASWVLLTDDPIGEPVVTIRRVAYDIDLQLHKIDQTPDYYDFKMPGFREAYRQSFLTGLHWTNFIQK